MLFKLAWRNIFRNKKRTLISIASVAFALFFSLAMRSMQYGSYERMVSNVVTFSSGYIQVFGSDFKDERSLDNSMEANDSLLNIIRDREGVIDALPKIESYGLAAAGNKSRVCMILGIDPEAEAKFSNLEDRLSQGEYLSSDDVSVVIAQGLGEYLKIGIGDTIIILGQGYHGVTAAGKYPVKGMISFPSPELNKSLIYLPLAEAQWLFGATGRWTGIAVMLDDPRDLDRQFKGIQQIPDTATHEVYTWETLMPEIKQAIQVDSAGGLLMMAILYIVIGFGLLGTVLMMTMERRYEFGVLLAVGMARRKIIGVIVSETFMLTALGIIAGLVMAVPLIVYFYHNPIPLGGDYKQIAEEYGMEAIIAFSLEPSFFIYQSLSIFVMSVIVSFYPISYISRMHPVKAMRT